MSEVLEEDGVPIAECQEEANSSNLTERSEVEESRPAEPQNSHIISGRDRDDSGETFHFDRSKPESELLEKGGFSLRMASFYDWPESMPHNATYLAQNGLFYTGSRDIVACSYCMVYMRASELREDPHIRSCVCLPGCPYAFNLTAA